MDAVAELRMGPALAAAPITSASTLVQPRAWSISERKLLLLVGDLAIVLGAMLTTELAGTTDVPGSRLLLLWMVLLAAVWITIARALDCYDLVVAARPGDALGRISLAAGLTLAAYSLIPYWSPPLPSGRWLIALHAALLFGPLLAWRAAYALLMTRPAFRVRALIVGLDRTAAAVGQMLVDEAKHGYELVGLIGYSQQELADPQFGDELCELVRGKGIREVILSAPTDRSPGLQAALVELAEQGVTVVTATDVYESLTGRALLPGTDWVWLATLPATTSLYAAARRLVDIFVAAVGLVMLAPLLLLAALAIVVDSPGPPLYWQERVGRYGRRFRIVKLRTMVQDAEAGGRAVWAQRRDPRVTRVGAFLRRSRLDEVPQLWNVLRGEMSLIGPRPERPDFVALLASEFPMYRARHAIRPGITGWAQVKYGYGASVEGAGTKLQYELYYVRHRSAFLDAVILLKTVAVMLRFKGT